MKKSYDIIPAVILILCLVISVIIGNAVIKGVVLFAFAAFLIVSTVFKLIGKKDLKFWDKFFYVLLLLFEIGLAIGAIFVIIAAIVGA